MALSPGSGRPSSAARTATASGSTRDPNSMGTPSGRANNWTGVPPRIRRNHGRAQSQIGSVGTANGNAEATRFTLAATAQRIDGHRLAGPPTLDVRAKLSDRPGELVGRGCHRSGRHWPRRRGRPNHRCHRSGRRPQLRRDVAQGRVARRADTAWHADQRLHPTMVEPPRRKRARRRVCRTAPGWSGH